MNIKNKFYSCKKDAHNLIKLIDKYINGDYKILEKNEIEDKEVFNFKCDILIECKKDIINKVEMTEILVNEIEEKKISKSDLKTFTNLFNILNKIRDKTILIIHSN